MPRFATRLTKMHKSFVREILKATQKREVISFAGGVPNPEFFPVQEIAEATAAFETESFVSGRKRLIDAAEKGWRISVPPTPDMLLPHLTEFRRWSKWIAAHSRWARERDHD